MEPDESDCQDPEPKVLILIVMEDTLGVTNFRIETATGNRLNPYCNGRYSWRYEPHIDQYSVECLNPYCNGRYSWSDFFFEDKGQTGEVLILIVMEDTLGAS